MWRTTAGSPTGMGPLHLVAAKPGNEAKPESQLQEQFLVIVQPNVVHMVSQLLWVKVQVGVGAQRES